ncbi:hypothetical protein [Chryseobacterium foetidum]|uniref:hypothetical protein n=1 Tax=Chryseobacterium foetidum TaxID=2951057 RepID=UPI0021CA6909|nr:hypothetical protein [Chryseobacterium foetidum]
MLFSQQTEDFRAVKMYYNQHRSMLNQEFKKKFDKEQNNFVKISIKKDFQLFMRKMDSIENVALIGVLLKTKNLEDLERFNSVKSQIQNRKDVAQTIDKDADYPGGINALRQEVANLFYSDGVYTDVKDLKTHVDFIVEKDGSISHVKAEGENFTFNRQAEIALYSVAEKFSPLYINGIPVRSRFKLPLSLKFD